MPKDASVADHAATIYTANTYRPSPNSRLLNAGSLLKGPLFHWLISSGHFIALSAQLPITLILETLVAAILSNNNDTNILLPPSPTQPFRLIYSRLGDHLAPINTGVSSVMTAQLSFKSSFYVGLARLSNALIL